MECRPAWPREVRTRAGRADDHRQVYLACTGDGGGQM